MFRHSRSVMSQVSKMSNSRTANSVFMCCDIQEPFRQHIPRYQHVVECAKLMLHASNIMSIPVVCSEQIPIAKTEPELLELVRDQSVNPSRPSVFYTKKRFSMYTEDLTNFFSSIPEVKNMYIFGLEAHVCILQTALEARAQGLNVFVLADAVASQRSLDCEYALQRLAHAGCVLTTTESALYAIMETSENPHFKKMLGHVKTYSSAIKQLNNAKL